MAETTTEPERVVTEYANAINERELSKVSDVLSESFTFTGPMAGTIRGAENAEAYIGEIFEGFSDFRITVREMLADGNVVVTESTLSGTHDGEFDGIPPTHREVEIPEMAKFVVEDGKLQAERAYFDQHGFLEQLGLADE